MKKERLDSAVLSLARIRSFQLLLLLFLSFLYLFVTYQLPLLFDPSPDTPPARHLPSSKLGSLPRPLHLDRKEEIFAPVRPSKLPLPSSSPSATAQPSSPLGLPPSSPRRALQVSGLVFSSSFSDANFTGNGTELHRAASDAWESGRKVFSELEQGKLGEPAGESEEEKGSGERGAEVESCPHSITMSGDEFGKKGRVLVLPCGLTLGSHITIVGKPHKAHPEYDPKISVPKEGDHAAMVSQFMMELQGLKTVDGEDPPRILHFNPRLKGDWSSRPVIEQNTCYRMQWGSAQRCEGWKSRADEETVDRLVKCEKWIRDDGSRSEESKASWWLKRLIGRTRTKKVLIDWPFPFVEEKLFVLTLSAGLEGYHVNVDGRHITSFPYRTGFVLEDATGLSLNGDVDVKSIFAGSLPITHPSFSPQRSLEMSPQWQAAPLPDGPVELFIGILSAGNHFAERMAVRKSWMQSIANSKNVVARFFVAMHGRNEVNVELKKEAEFFGDIVIVPFMDSYDLVVLKTAAICEYGIRAVSAKYIMKCDDDTFVRVDAVLKEVKKVPSGRSLYVGNMNYFHKPLRQGKWAVNYEEWPEEDYPPYANGPGYIVSSDIARFVISEFEKHTLRLFKMEDVSMGMWVEQFNSTILVQYVHDQKFCQFGCIDGYFTAHYQSPRHMLCMWDKLQKTGRPQCCNMR